LLVSIYTTDFLLSVTRNP